MVCGSGSPRCRLAWRYKLLRSKRMFMLKWGLNPFKEHAWQTRKTLRRVLRPRPRNYP